MLSPLKMLLNVAIFSILIILILFVVLSSEGVRNKMTFFPDKISEIPVPDYASERQIPTKDGETLQAFLFSHGEDGAYPLIIYFHGNAGNLYHRFDYAQQLFEMDQDVLLVSYRGYSKSTGKASEKGIYIDGESTVNYATNSLGYKEITIFGRSLGSAVAIHVAQNKTIKGVILVTPLTSGKDMASAMGLGWIKFVAGNSYNSLEKINNIKSRILIVHGDRDELVPYEMGKRLFEKFEGDINMITIKGGGHNDLQEVDPVLFWGEIENFLK